MAALPKAIGWIGLGLMGDPMARNLLKKTPEDTQLFVYDVVPAAVEKFVQEGKGRVQACQSSREVAERSVCHLHIASGMLRLAQGKAVLLTRAAEKM